MNQGVCLGKITLPSGSDGVDRQRSVPDRRSHGDRTGCASSSAGERSQGECGASLKRSLIISRRGVHSVLAEPHVLYGMLKREKEREGGGEREREREREKGGDQGV